MTVYLDISDAREWIIIQQNARHTDRLTDRHTDTPIT